MNLDYCPAFQLICLAWITSVLMGGGGRCKPMGQSGFAFAPLREFTVPDVSLITLHSDHEKIVTQAELDVAREAPDVIAVNRVFSARCDGGQPGGGCSRAWPPWVHAHSLSCASAFESLSEHSTPKHCTA